MLGICIPVLDLALNDPPALNPCIWLGTDEGEGLLGYELDWYD